MRKTWKNILLILLGVAVGIIIMFIFAFYSIKQSGGREFFVPILCGDLRISKIASSDELLSEKSDIDRTVVFEKGGTHFLMIHQNSAGISKEMVFFNDKGDDVFRVSLSESKKVMRRGLTFGPLDVTPTPNSERYYDFNLDGSFDWVTRFNEDGFTKEICAKIDGEWKIVDSIDTEQYIFEIEGKEYTMDYWMD
jgi:hypothetical protein